VKRLLPLAVLLAGCSNVKPLVIASHMSDPSDAGVSDTTADFIGAGVAMEFGGVTIDGAIGRKALNCSRDSCPSTLGGMVTFRWSPK
jgi:hypothetical protein